MVPIPALFAAAGLQAQTLTLTCDFGPPEVQDLGAATRLTVADCSPLQRVGAPVLPFRTLRVLLPPGTRVGNVQAQPIGDPAVLAVAQPVEHGRLPVRHPGANAPAAPDSEPNGPDPAIYLSDQLYPPAPAELASVQRLEGYAVALVRVFPVQYSPARAELRAMRRLRVDLVLAADSPQPRSPSLSAEIPPQPRARERLAAWVDNPELLSAYGGGVTKSSFGETCDYLLITKNDLLASFQPLLDLKTQQGLAVRVETVQTITNTVAGQDAPEKIRNFIREAYQTLGVRYVLLGGDVSTVPCRYAYVGMGALVANPSLPADLYYACLDGSWNSDGDSRWGEPTDGDGGGDVDLLAEVYVGRAPVDTVAEASVFVDKAIRYATEAHMHPTNILCLAEVLVDTPNGPAQGGDMFNPLLPLFADANITWLDDRFTVPAWVKQDALDAMNQSPHLVLLNGHGNHFTLIGAERPFIRSIETPDLALLTNQWPFLAYSVGCNVGQFDNDRFSPDAIGEELVKQHSRGAFAAILNSRLGWYDEQDEAKYSGEFQASFFTQLLNHGQTNFGVANQLSKHDLASHPETSGIMTYRWCYYEITLFGDPHLAWQQPPSTLPINVTSQGTPYSWLASYGWTNEFETAAAADTDKDGMPAWQEYIAGTSPVDPASVFRVATLTPAGSAPELAWPSVEGRRYSVWGAASPASGSFVLITNNLSATPPLNRWLLNPSAEAGKYFRIGVELAP